MSYVYFSNVNALNLIATGLLSSINVTYQRGCQAIFPPGLNSSMHCAHEYGYFILEVPDHLEIKSNNHVKIVDFLPKSLKN